MQNNTATAHFKHRFECCLHGYHVWIQYPTIGKVLGTVRERENLNDCYAVAVLEADTCCVVRHLPEATSVTHYSHHRPIRHFLGQSRCLRHRFHAEYSWVYQGLCLLISLEVQPLLSNVSVRARP